MPSKRRAARALAPRLGLAACLMLVCASAEIRADPAPADARHMRSGAAAAGGLDDNDRDGLSDAFEAELLERFLPAFLVHAEDCDGLPAEFRAGSPEPRVVARNGTIYGRVFASGRPSWPAAWVEIYYYHLWARDCGRLAHALDVEHVSVLARADGWNAPLSAWRARYWYAAAHEGTVCDVSHGTAAEALDAVQRGPTVWISRGKHASFLTEGQCRWGCGDDRCDEMIPMPVARLINIGEPGAPLNGATWIESSAWPLAVKMQSDFSNAVLARLMEAGPGQIVALGGLQQPWQAVILAGGSTAGAVGTSNRETGGAVAVGGRAVGSALATTAKKVGASVARSARSVWSFLGFVRE